VVIGIPSRGLGFSPRVTAAGYGATLSESTDGIKLRHTGKRPNVNPLSGAVPCSPNVESLTPRPCANGDEQLTERMAHALAPCQRSRIDVLAHFEAGAAAGQDHGHVVVIARLPSETSVPWKTSVLSRMVRPSTSGKLFQLQRSSEKAAKPTKCRCAESWRSSSRLLAWCELL